MAKYNSTKASFSMHSINHTKISHRTDQYAMM